MNAPSQMTQNREFDEDFFEAQWKLSEQHREVKESIAKLSDGSWREGRTRDEGGEEDAVAEEGKFVCPHFTCKKACIP